MKNTKKILPLLLLSILFQTKNVKAVSKDVVYGLYLVTSGITLLHDILPNWVPEVEEHPKWHDLKFKQPIPENVTHFIKEKANINIENTDINFYPPTIINQILAASIDLDIDPFSELIENSRRHNAFYKKMNELNIETNVKTKLSEIGITMTEIVVKSITKATIAKILENHKICKRLSKIILLTGLDFAGNWFRKYLCEEIKEIFPNYSVVVINSLAKNIAIETFGEIIQRLFIDNEKTKKQKYLYQQIDNMMSNNELVLKLKNNELETSPIKIK